MNISDPYFLPLESQEAICLIFQLQFYIETDFTTVGKIQIEGLANL